MIRSSILVAAVAIGACAVPARARTPDQLEGEWVSDCTRIGKNQRHGHVIRLTLNGDRIAAVAQLHATAACDSPTIQGTFEGRIDRMRAREDRVELDYSVGDATFTLQRQDVVDYYNRVGGCGLDQWQLNTPKSVLGQRCAPLDVPQRGHKLYDSAWLDGDTLRMGAFPLDTSNRSPEARPSTPRPLVFRRAIPARR